VEQRWQLTLLVKHIEITAQMVSNLLGAPIERLTWGENMTLFTCHSQNVLLMKSNK
jgi:hypothetical protein